MIINLEKFIEKEQPYWYDLEKMLRRLERKKEMLSLKEAKQFNYLYQRTSSDLARLNTFAAEPEMKQFLEGLVGRAYSQLHKNREKRAFRPGHWFRYTLPTTFRKHLLAFLVALGVTMLGSFFGGLALAIDDKAIDVVLPDMDYLRNPSKRVEMEESERSRERGLSVSGSAWYFQNNTRVSITAMGLGASWGIGTIVVLLLNGVLLGAVTLNYMVAGETVFLLGWLLPHGSVEIPGILIAGQAGLVLGSAMIGWGRRIPMAQRLREASKDLATLITAAAIMMMWAGIIEANFSQTHEPALPYWFKISVGVFQLVFLIWYFGFCGNKKPRIKEAS